MTRPSKWDLKTWAAVFAFFGVTSATTLVAFAQRITGWLAGPAIEQHQSRALAHQDSLNAERWDSLRVWRLQDHAVVLTLAGKMDTLTATLAEVPGIDAAARRRKARETARRSIIGSAPSMVDERNTWRTLKGERIP